MPERWGQTERLEHLERSVQPAHPQLELPVPLEPPVPQHLGRQASLRRA